MYKHIRHDLEHQGKLDVEKCGAGHRIALGDEFLGRYLEENFSTEVLGSYTGTWHITITYQEGET